MKETWRLIEDAALPGPWNMAVDFSLMKSVSRAGSRPVIRIYRWERPAITIGYFQETGDELNMDACAADGVPVIRRITGGGAVLHDREITYSICLPLTHPQAFGTVLDSYRKLLGPVIRSLGKCGVKCEYQPVNDLVADGKKISGSAQTRRDGVLLQHGTILLDVDPEKMFRYLRISKEKIAGRDLDEASSRVTSMKAFLGPSVLEASFAGELYATLADSFSSDFSIELKASRMSSREHEEALSIRQRLFENPEWNIDRAVKP
jgi:lipoate---protein ligase